MGIKYVIYGQKVPHIGVFYRDIREYYSNYIVFSKIKKFLAFFILNILTLEAL